MPYEWSKYEAMYVQVASHPGSLYSDVCIWLRAKSKVTSEVKDKCHCWSRFYGNTLRLSQRSYVLVKSQSL